MDQHELKPFFYSIREAKITVAIMDCGLGVARGIAICSDGDQWWKKRGQSIAAGRMFQAVNCCTVKDVYFGCPVNKPHIETMVDNHIGNGDYPIYKSSFEPEYVARNRFEESIMRKWGVNFKPAPTPNLLNKIPEISIERIKAAINKYRKDGAA